MIEVARKQRKHAAGLARAVRGEDQDGVAQRSHSFLEAFVRPYGLDHPATPVLIDQLERLPDARPSPPQPGAGLPPDQLQASIAALERIFGLAKQRRR